MDFFLEGIGMVAGTLTTVSFLPQVMKIWHSRNVSSISLLMYSLFSLGVFLWIIYGIVINSPSLIIFNLITFCLSISILYLKIRLERRYNPQNR
jgi:MtN3 and saliva related transmembrane protein